MTNSWLDSAQLQSALIQRDVANDLLEKLQIQIATERSRPWKQVFKYLAFRLLSRLSRFSPPLPQNMAARFGRSASRKNPYRSLLGTYGPLDTSITSQARRTAKAIVGGKASDPMKQNILIVSHDATRTGAPILTLNLVQSLSLRYNITVLVLRGGGILNDLKESAIKVYNADSVGRADYDQMIASICKNMNFAFAIVNSVVSIAVLKHLKAQSVATISLLHEFASYTPHSSKNRSAFAEIFEESSETVFSTRLTRDDALLETTDVDLRFVHVLPQGKCVVPLSGISPTKFAEESAWLTSILRPDGLVEKRTVVIGAGTVLLRKGVDLFIETATRVVKSEKGANVDFFWIGSGYDPLRDRDYSAYLHDQIKRSDIADRISFLPSTAAIECAYSLADIFMLPSRLDPLPNVTIDAMSIGLPVLCFEDASGIADCLTEAGLKDTCVANYIDTSDLADKILALATQPALRSEVSARSLDYAARTFNFESYAAKIETLGLAAAKRQKYARVSE